MNILICDPKPLQNLSKQTGQKQEATQWHESTANAKNMRLAVAGLELAAVVAMATGSTWTGDMGGMHKADVHKVDIVR